MPYEPSKAIAREGVLSIKEKFLPGEGENQTPAPLAAEATTLVQETVKKAFVASGCKGYARIDCFYQDAAASPTGIERIVILEFNTLPGLTPATCLFHQAAEVGIRPMDLIDKIVELGFENHKKLEAAAAIQTEIAPAQPTTNLEEMEEATAPVQPSAAASEIKAKDEMPDDFIMKMF